MTELSKQLAIEDVMGRIERWARLAPGEFHSADVDRDLDIRETCAKIDRTIALENLVGLGILQRVGNRRGWYRPSQTDLVKMDFIETKEAPVDIWLPFRLNKMVSIMPGNIIQISGEKNSGKTALMLNFIKNNMHQWKVHYFNSEMGAGELRLRLSLAENMGLRDWKFAAYERYNNFGEVVFPGEGNLNIIDFLETHDDFYRMGQFMREIHEALHGAIAVVVVQKNKGNEFGLGGARTEEKPRLILNLEPGKMKVKMAKNWRSQTNPNGMCIDYHIINGFKLRVKRDCIDPATQNFLWYEEHG